MFNEIILAIIQGITEWLPVSSSGHLVIYQEVFKTGTSVFFDLMLHLATLFVIVAVFWKEILNMIKAIIKLDFKSEYGRLVYLIIIGMIPTVIIGLVFRDLLISLYHNLTAVGVALIVNGFFLYYTKNMKRKGKITIKKSLWIGLAQGFAIIPGISRSGSTISTALYLGIDRKKAAAYSFLLAIPTILGATILEFDAHAADITAGTFMISVAVAMLVGYVSLKLLLKLVLRKKLHYFAYYCWVVGGIILLVSITS